MLAEVMFSHGKCCTVTALKCNGIAKVCKTLLQSSLLKYYDIIIFYCGMPCMLVDSKSDE